MPALKHARSIALLTALIACDQPTAATLREPTAVSAKVIGASNFGKRAFVLQVVRIPPEIFVEFGINRGLWMASQNGQADFALRVTFTYQSQGEMRSETQSVLVSDTRLDGTLNVHQFAVSTRFTLVTFPDLDTPIDVDVEVVAH